jgi:EpsI family protein
MMKSLQTRVIIVIGCLLLALVPVLRADRSEVVPLRAPLATFPMTIGGWQGVEDPPMSQSVIDVLKADDVLTRTYYLERRDVANLYVGYWQSQRQGETIHSPLNCLPGSGWEPISKTIVSVPTSLSTVGSATMNRDVIQKGLDRQLVLYWYQSHGRMIASEYWSKFYLVTDAVRLNRTDGAIIRVIAPVVGDSPDAEANAERVATAFLRAILPNLNGLLPS